MTTVINNPGDNGNGSSGAAGVVIGAVLVILVLVVALVFAVPYIRRHWGNNPGSATINVQLPAGQNSNPSGNGY